MGSIYYHGSYMIVIVQVYMRSLTPLIPLVFLTVNALCKIMTIVYNHENQETHVLVADWYDVLGVEERYRSKKSFEHRFDQPSFDSFH